MAAAKGIEVPAARMRHIRSMQTIKAFLEQEAQEAHDAEAQPAEAQSEEPAEEPKQDE